MVTKIGYLINELLSFLLRVIQLPVTYQVQQKISRHNTPYMDVIIPYMDVITPYMDVITPYMDVITPYMDTITLNKKQLSTFN